MALRPEPERPYVKHIWKGHKDMTTNITKPSPLNRTSTSIPIPIQSMGFNTTTKFQRNITTSNQEIADLIEQSKPTHIQAMIYPKRKAFKRDADDIYTSIRS